ncbi:MAG: MOP flippase family protein [Bacteroidetes bacterium]|nr:MOP flippase family protein [Bacteroidota bacterium]
MDAGDHKKKTISSLKWNVMSQIITQGTTIVVGILLARLLGPKAFGLIGMITVFTGFLNVFKDFGLGSALIHKKVIDSKDTSTAFWANLILGVLLAVILFVGSSFIANFYGEDLLGKLTKVMSIMFIIQSLNYVQLSLFKKSLDFKKLFWVNTLAVVTSGGVAIILALMDYGVWSLIFQSILRALITAFVLWFLSNWRPSFVFSKERFNELMKFSLPLMGNQTFHYWTRNLDKLLIGKYLGMSDLGYYNRSYSLMLVPVKRVSSVISTVMFPSLSIIQDDKLRIKSIYLKMSRIIASVTFPIALIFFLSAEPFVYGILGNEWLEAIPIIKILAFLSAIQSINTLNGNIYLSQGATALQFKLKLFTTPIPILLIIGGLQFGINGVALAILCSSIITSWPNWFFAGRLINCSVKEIIINISPIILVCIPIILIGMFLKEMLFNSVPEIFQLAIILVYVIGFYVLLIKLFNLIIYKEWILILREQIPVLKSRK